MKKLLHLLPSIAHGMKKGTLRSIRTIALVFPSCICHADPLMGGDYTIESARQAIDSKSTTEVERIAARVALAQLMAPHDPGLCLEQADRAILEQQRITDDQKTGWPYLVKAMGLLNRDELGQATGCVREAERFDGLGATQEFKTMLAFLKAEMFMLENQTDSAELGPLRVVYHLYSGPEVENKRFLLYSRLYRQEGDFPRAMEAATNGNRGYWELGDSLGIGLTHNAMGNVLVSIGFLNDAVVEYQHALRAIALFGDASLLRGRFLSNLGYVLSSLGRYNDARAALKEAESIAIRHKATGLWVAILNNLGEAYAGEHDFKMAIRQYQSAIAVRPKDNASLNRAILEFNMRKNAVELMYTLRPAGIPIWRADALIEVNGQVFGLPECIAVCEKIHDELQRNHYRDFDLEVVGCLQRAYNLAGYYVRPEVPWIKQTPKPVDKKEINETIGVYDSWRNELAGMEGQRKFMEELRSISWKGLLIPCFLLLVLYILGRNPGERTIAWLFIIFGLLATAWVEMMIHHWFTSLAVKKELGYWALSIFVCMLSLGAHVIGHELYKGVLQRRQAKLDIKRDKNIPIASETERNVVVRPLAVKRGAEEGAKTDRAMEPVSNNGASNEAKQANE